MITQTHIKPVTDGKLHTHLKCSDAILLPVFKSPDLTELDVLMHGI